MNFKTRDITIPWQHAALVAFVIAMLLLILELWWLWPLIVFAKMILWP